MGGTSVADDKRERALQIKRLQQNLSSIRKIAGWTAETLGDKIGVTKQTISNLENAKSPMTFTQYIAIRTALDFEIENNKENEVLPKVVAILLDSGELDDDNYSKVKDVADTVAASAAGGTSAAKLDKVFDVLLASLPFIIGPIITKIIRSSANWKKLLK
jgi:transcriptional regulator with XRE-family HTH domain